MSHENYVERLSAYLEDDLHARERAQLERHLANCPDCALELRAMQSTLSLLHQLPNPTPPPDLADAVMARVRAGEARPPLGARLMAGLRSGVSGMFEGSWVPPVAALALGIGAIGLIRGFDLQTVIQPNPPTPTHIVASRPAVVPNAHVSPGTPMARSGRLSSAPTGGRLASLQTIPSAEGLSGSGRLIGASATPSESATVASDVTAAAVVSCLGEKAPELRDDRDVATAEAECLQWEAWRFMNMALGDTAAFLWELEELPVGQRARMLRKLTDLAVQSGSAPLLARELRQTQDPRAMPVAVRLERVAHER